MNLLIKYIILFIVLSLIYVVSVFGGGLLRLDLFLMFFILFLIAQITPFLGRLILKIDSFYRSYIILILAILPTTGIVPYSNRYPYIIIEMMGSDYLEHSKNGIGESYILPSIFIPLILIFLIMKKLKERGFIFGIEHFLLFIVVLLPLLLMFPMIFIPITGMIIIRMFYKNKFRCYCASWIRKKYGAIFKIH